MRIVIIWHWFIKNLVGTRRHYDVMCLLGIWPPLPPPPPPPPPNILNLPTPMGSDQIEQSDRCTDRCSETDRYTLKIQSTLVISKPKGPSYTLRDIRTSTYPICSNEEKTILTTIFYKWLCNLTPFIRNINWKYCGKGEKLLPRSNFSSFL